MPLFAAPQSLNRLQIEITTGCNLRCAGCQRTLGMAKGDWVNRHMEPDLFAKVIANAPAAAYVVLQGIGEPSLHPRLEQLISIAKASGKYPDISFNTNALAREPEDFVAWKALGLSHVSISVDSLNPVTAEKARAGTDVVRLRQAILKLVALFGGRVTFSVVVSKANLGEMTSLLAELALLGAAAVEVQPLVAYGPETQALALSPEDRETLRSLAATARSRYPRMAVMLAPILGTVLARILQKMGMSKGRGRLMLPPRRSLPDRPWNSVNYRSSLFLNCTPKARSTRLKIRVCCASTS